MIDGPTELRPYVRISAEYPATDGSTPQNIEVVWETDFPDSEMVCRVIAALGRVPRGRYDGPIGGEILARPLRPVIRDSHGNEIR